MNVKLMAQYSPDTLERAISYLRASERAHHEALQHAMRADDGALFAIDLIMHGVAQRSLRLIDGFALLVERSNDACAVPLLRLQLDNVMRFFALSLVHDKNDVLVALEKGKPFSNLRSRDGQPLTDGYLAKEISKLYPWILDVYKRTSGFVHLSKPGLLSSVVGVGDEASRTAYISIGTDSGRPWSDAEKKEVVDAFIAATEVLIQLFVNWIEEKRKVAAQRINSGSASANSGSAPVKRNTKRKRRR